MDNPREVIWRWRQGRNLSLKGAGELLGCDASMLAYIERGDKTPTQLSLILAIEKHVGVPPQAWLDCPVEPAPDRPVRRRRASA